MMKGGTGNRRSATRGRKGRSRKRFALWKPLLIFLLFISVWLLYSSIRGILSEYLAHPVLARYGSVELVMSAKVLVVRPEKVVVSPFDGELKKLVAEGDMVRTDSPVVEIVNPAARRDAEERLKRIDRDIAQFDATQGQRLNELRSQYESLGDLITDKFRSLRVALSNGDGDLTYAVADELSALSDSRRAVDDEVKKLEESRANLERERVRAQAALASHSTVIVSPATGLVSFNVDGLEERLTPEKVTGLNMREVMSLKGEPGNGQELSVRSGEALFKVIDPMQTTLVGSLPIAEVQDIETKSSVIVRLAGEEVPAVLFHVGNVDRNDYRVFSLRLGKPVTCLLPRRLDIEIISKRWEGMIVPRKSLIKRGEEVGVYVVKQGRVSFHPVEVFGGDASRAVIRGVSEGTSVISNPLFVREGVRIRR